MLSCSQSLIIDWYNFFTDICTKALLSLNWRLGDGHIVEKDESVFAHKRKYGKGKVPLHQQWVFGIVERKTKKNVLQLVPERTKKVLYPIIEKHIIKGATIHHDDFSTYRNLDSLFYKHMAVNHSKEFVSEEGACTNTIEGLWGLVKNRIN